MEAPLNYYKKILLSFEEKTGYTIEVVKAVVRSPEKKRNLNLEKIALSNKEAEFFLLIVQKIAIIKN